MLMELRDDFEMQSVVTQLDTVGGASFPALPDTLRSSLLETALEYTFVKREEVVGPAKVRQDLSAADVFPPESPLLSLRDAWQSLLKRKLSELPERDLFSSPLQLNDLSIQRYEVGSKGITPHMDAKSCINLVSVFVLTGNCQFGICQDRSGTNPIALDARPGNVLLLRAPGFRGSDFRPFHFVTDIQGPRITVGIRQETKR